MTSLPHLSKTFVGRTDELRDIAARLADPACQLLTLFGPGGIGKTYLALQAGHRVTLLNGIYFVPLQPLTSPDFIISAITEALGLQFYGDDPREKLLNYLHDKSLLLVLDNFEHLLDGVSFLIEILSQSPGIKLLVTSRERLNIHPEWVLEVTGLSFPSSTNETQLESYGAVQLFARNAHRMNPDFSLSDETEAVIRICTLLEGMPLALELASSWVSVLTCSEIVQELERGLDILETSARDVPERHLSMRAVLHHSWNLLSSAEQGVLKKLSVFRGGFTREAAHEVAGATLHNLKRLIDKSWLRHEATGRYDQHELLLHYTADKLAEAGEAEATTERHLDYFLHMAEQADAHGFDAEQIVWYERLETELDNLRAARLWSVRAVETQRGLRLAASLGWFFSERSYWKEGHEWLEQLLAANPDAPTSLRAKALHSAGALAGLFGDEQRSKQLCEQALALARSANDRWNIAWSLSQLANFASKDFDEAAAFLEESLALFREIDDPKGITHTLVRRGWIAFGHQDYAYMRQLVEEAQSRARQAGNKIMNAWTTYDLGRIAWFGDHDLLKARNYFENGLSLFREAGLGFQNPSILLASAEQAIGNTVRAQIIYEEVLLSLRETARNYNVTLILSGLASIAGVRGEFQRAARLMGAADSDNPAYQNLIPAEDFNFYSDVAAVRSQFGEEAFAAEAAIGRAMSKDQIIDYALESSTALPKPADTSPKPSADLLNHRELEILRLVADGLSNGEIAQQLHFTVSTVKWYLSEIYSKLGVHGRAKAVAYAREQGLLA